MIAATTAVQHALCVALTGLPLHAHSPHGPTRAVASSPVTGIPLIGVLAVQGDVREHLAALAASGARTTTVRRAEEVDAVDGLVIPGGESTTMDKLVRAFGLQGPLRERIAAGMPVYGSCAGMIMLADRIADAPARPADPGGPGHHRAPQRVRPAGRLLRGGPAHP